MPAEFVHLHVHTDYSMLDGACKINRLADMAEEHNMKAMAITDHGNMHGVFEFFTTMKKRGIKPIFGCEFYMAPESRHDRNPSHQRYHQLLFAKDFAGYQNLCRLNAKAHLEGFYFKPRIDKEVLAEFGKGIVGTSSCIGGEIPQIILEQDLDAAKRAIDDYVQILGKENFFLELQDHGMTEQRKVNRALVQISKEMDLQLMATNDVHYLTRDHAKSHEVLLCIGTQKTMSDANRMQFPSEDFYVKSPEEMARIFGEVPESLSNTLAIAEMCNVELQTGVNHYPVYDPPEGFDQKSYLLDQCKQGLIERYHIDLYENAKDQLPREQRRVVERMEYELDIIERMGFTSYFLVVWDFLLYARKRAIPIGPGRGSGAGSIVAYLLHITDIEPLRYNLLFERFLNPERVSPPDFDIDLCERRRGEVIEYVRDKYGHDNVAQIGTFGTLKAKAVIKDVARALGRSFDEGNKLTKMIPADPKMTLDKALDEVSDLQDAMNEEWISEVIKYARPLEGLNRNCSIHAAGVIIGDQPLTNLVPLSRGQNNEVVTQFPAGPCEDLGLLKMDFLGLSTLTIIQDACDWVKKSKGIEIDPGTIPFEDAPTFELLNKGKTVCVFQLESSGMQELCRRFGVDRIEDIIALIALYRPGPLQFLDDFIERKFGRTRVDYDVPVMQEILQETYGIMLYQEQVMQVVQQVAGFSLGQADILRRAMGKKKADVMAAQYEKFEEGCAANGVDARTAKSIWDKIETFAGYGFNKSHSAAYAFLAYRTAYLKANHPVAFMCANLTNEMGTAERVAVLINECRDMGIEVLPPDINVSEMDFTVDGRQIRFGLAAIKGVGEAAAEAVLKARKDGPFASLQELCERTGSAMTRRLMESLCQCGAFDCFELRRSQMFAMIEDVIQRAHQSVKDREAGQENFFDMLAADDEDDGLELQAPDLPEWDQQYCLAKEKELLGFYVTGHPLDSFQEQLKRYGRMTLTTLPQLPENQGVRVGGLISSLQLKNSRRDGSPWAILELEDLETHMEALAFPETYAKCGHAIAAEAAVFIDGFVSKRDGEDQTKIIVDDIIPMAEAEQRLTKELLIGIDEAHVHNGTLQELRDLLHLYPGETSVVLRVGCESGEYAFVETSNRYWIRYDEEVTEAIRELLGADVWLKPNPKTELPFREQRRWGNNG